MIGLDRQSGMVSIFFFFFSKNIDVLSWTPKGETKLRNLHPYVRRLVSPSYCSPPWVLRYKEGEYKYDKWYQLCYKVTEANVRETWWILNENLPVKKHPI